mgnify:CR=1 FL=1
MGIVPDNRGKKYKTHDQEMIKRLASTMCSYEEIGFIIGMTGAGVKKRFSKAIDEGRAKGKASLRQAQFEKALAGDTRMQIWLGRNYLEQKPSGRYAIMQEYLTRSVGQSCPHTVKQRWFGGIN